MRYFASFSLQVLCLFFLVQIVPAEPPSDGDWRFIWGDEFDGQEVDDKKWEKVG